MEHYEVCDNPKARPYLLVQGYTAMMARMVMHEDITDVAAMFAILTYSIEEVAGGNVSQGIFYASSVFYRAQTNFYAPFSTKKGYTYDSYDGGLEEGEKFGMTGFHRMFQDDAGNQVEHFINEAAFSATFPSFAEEGAFLFEAQHGLPFDSDQWADYWLGVVAADYARKMREATSSEQRALITDQTIMTIQNGIDFGFIPALGTDDYD